MAIYAETCTRSTGRGNLYGPSIYCPSLQPSTTEIVGWNIISISNAVLFKQNHIMYEDGFTLRKGECVTDIGTQWKTRNSSTPIKVLLLMDQFHTYLYSSILSFDKTLKNLDKMFPRGNPTLYILNRPIYLSRFDMKGATETESCESVN